ncbi:uncharacterized protein LOC143071559 [Mytilus galloprovincialis]|uniref:uncharacterized protein LOC143071559 n=1 Tax=Mytilus galloprovincialis TaxID=29158 RepID=UPI003F7BAE78
MSKLANRILNSDKEVAAVKYNIKEQRCLKKNLVTLDAEAQYSVKLIDMENRGMKVFYRRFRDKVSKIKTHLKVNEVTRLKDLEATGRLSPPQNTVNTTSMLRIADAEKRLKLQGREHLRKTKSAFTSRSVEAIQESKSNSVMSGTFDSHFNESESVHRLSTSHRPSTSALDSKLNGSRESISKKRQSIESLDRPQFFKSKTCDAIIQESDFVEKIESKEILTPPLEQTTEKYEPSKCTGICIVYGETPTETYKPVVKEPEKEDTPNKKMSLTFNFIETGNVNSPRIMNKTSSVENEMPKKEEDTVSQSPRQCNDVNNGTLTVNPIEDMLDESNGTKHEIPDTIDKKEQKSGSVKPDSNNNATPRKISQHKTTNQFSRTCRHQKHQNETRGKDDTTKLRKTEQKPKPQENKQDSDIKNNCQKDKTLHTNAGRDSPVSIKSYNKVAVPRTRNGQSKSARSNFERQSRKKSCNSSPERRSFSATGKSTNFAQMTKQYSCHSSIDKEAMKIQESRMSFSISDGLFSLGDDPYEERRQLLLMDEHNRFVILLHKKEDYLERIEEYIKKQLEESLYGCPDGAVGGKKKTKSPKDIWDEIKHCRYLRTDDEEDIDLSQVVTLASEQIKSKQGLKYKPLFGKQKSKKTVIVEPKKTEDNKSKDPVSSDSLG